MFFLKGLIVGFVIAVPMGPIGILCARRTLTHGRKAGFFSGMGAATADVLYGFIAAFGVPFISDLFAGKQVWLRLSSGAFLCLLGVKTFIEKPERKNLSSILKKKKKRHAGMYVSTFFLTLTNPLTIFSLAAVFAGLGLTGIRSSIISALILVLGVFLGSVLWWLFFTGVFSVFKRRFSHHEIQWINRIAGLIIAGSGVLVLAGRV
ncbi:MAG: LysE family transporter [Nitrospiraceae bacterium]|nr:LysE family transporter [Nitrospiraceae bacterium]